MGAGRMIPTSRLWPLRYVHSDSDRLRCAMCFATPQRESMIEVTQVSTWQGQQDEPGGPIEPRVVLVCAKPSEACRAAQGRYCA